MTTTKTALRPAAFGEDLIVAAETVLSLRETSPVVLEAVDGVRIEIQRIYGGILVRAEKPATHGLADLALTARNVHGDHFFNSQLGFYRQVLARVQAEAEYLRSSLREGEEDLEEDDTFQEGEETGEGLSVFVPEFLRRLRAYISNLR